MGIIERQKQDIQKQIILIIEAIEYLATIDNTDIKTVGAYIADTDFLASQHFLLLISPTKIKPTKINGDGYYSGEYEPYCYYSELQALINDFIYNGVIDTKLQLLGFAKKRFLLHLQNKGFAVGDNDIKNSFSPIYDDMCIGDDVAGFAFYEALPKDYNILLQENRELRAEIEQLAKQSAEPVTPAHDDILSDELTNVEIINTKQKILGKTNNLIAKAVKSLDISNILTKDDIAKFILPYSQDMVLFLNSISKSEQTTSIKTIKDNHLKDIAFKNGKPSKKDSEKVRIDLLFDRTKLSDTEN